MHCMLSTLAQTPGHRPEVYAFAMWALVVLLTALLLAFLVIRLIRIWWAKADARATAHRHTDDIDDRDPWTESGRRVSLESDDEDEQDGPDR